MAIAATSRSPSTAERVAAAVDRVRWLAVIRIALGALFVSVFFENLEKQLYTAKGYSGLIDGYANSPKATGPAFWRETVMPFFSDNSSFFAPVQAVFEATLGVALVLGVATGAVALAAAAHFAALWLSELGVTWVWELLSPIIVAVVVGVSALPGLLERSSPLAERLLGPPTFGRAPLPARLALAAAGGLALAGAVLAAHTGARHYRDVALEAGLAFAAVLVGLALLDLRRAEGSGKP